MPPVLRRLHPDFHNPPQAVDVGGQFDGDEFAEDVIAAGADSVIIFAKDHNGYAYWDTSIGHAHPNLAHRDFFGAAVEACKRRGLTVLAYYSCTADDVAAENEDWRQMDKEGKTPLIGPYKHVCPNSGYLEEYLLPQMAEVTRKYPIDGWHVDIIYFGTDVCLCSSCQSLMRQKQVDYTDKDQLGRFRADSIGHLVRRMTETVRAGRDNLILSYNNLLKIGCANLVKWADIVDVEVSYSWAPQGYAELYGRHLQAIGRDFAITACSRARGYGSYGSLTSEHQLKYEMALSLMMGGKCQIVNEMLPNGKMLRETVTRIGRVFGFVKEYEPWCAGAELVPYAAVMGQSRPDIDANAPDSIWGAARILSESHIPFHVVDETSELKPFSLVVLPELASFGLDLYERLRQYVEQGGTLLVTGNAAFADKSSATLLAELLGVNLSAAVCDTPCYLRLKQVLADGLPEMDRLVYGNWAQVTAGDDAESLAKVVMAAYPEKEALVSWGHPPDDGASGFDGIVAYTCGKGRTFYAACPVFVDYSLRPDVEQMRFIKNLLGRVAPESQRPYVIDLSDSARVSLLRQDHRWVLHVLRTEYRAPARKSSVDTSDDMSQQAMPFLPAWGQMGLGIAPPSELNNVSVRLRPPHTFKQVYLAPSREELDFTREDDGAIEVIIPQMGAYTMLVIE